jgi:cell division protein FtsQ
MKTFKKILIWSAVIIYIGLMLGFFANRYEKLECKSIRIKVADSSDHSFLISKDILKMLEINGIKYKGLPLTKIDLNKIERVVKANQIVDECKAYTGVNGILHVEITQREPIVRIFDKNRQGYYIDDEGNVLNLSSRCAPHVMVVNGYIRSPFKIGQPVNINTLRDTLAMNKFKDICTLVNFISEDDFWNAQIVQIYVNHENEFELIPRVGPHIILLGSIDDYQEKFHKLEIFYKEGLNHVGWNQYLTINLKFKDQVVCTKI